MSIKSVSFSGIYDIRFPEGTSTEYIQSKVDIANNFLKEQNLDLNGNPLCEVRILDSFSLTKSNRTLANKGIRISTPIDNPWFLCNLFDKLDKKLSQEYVNKTKVELILDTQA